MKNAVNYFVAAALWIAAITDAPAQKKQEPANDFNTPLHLLAPDYQTPYGKLTTGEVKASLDRVLHYLERETPARIIDERTRQAVTDYSKIDEHSRLDRGAFRISSYEWGVTYAGMMEVAASTGDTAYLKYVSDRFRLLSQAAPEFKRIYTDYGLSDPQMKQLLTPHALDDAGAMCAAMIRYQQTRQDLDLKAVIDNYINYILYKEYRLSDGTFARLRPHKNTVWLDDLFMSVPAIARMGKLTGESKYFNEATRQVKQFTERMFVPEKGLYMHGWVESMTEHPAFFWGRANGWAILTLSEVLDVLPESHPDYPFVLAQFRKHIKGIAGYQSGEGFWHQLLDRTDSYLETSATAIYVYCLAHGINKGWIDPKAYGPAAQLGWQAVSTQINKDGQVEGTCVGTGMAFDPSYYYHRPVNVYAAHGYGPVLLAGAEMIRLLNTLYPKMNDSAIQYYTMPQRGDDPIFRETDPEQPADIVAGTSRKKKGQPAVFVIGDSTVKNGRGKGDGGQWGWGSFFEQFFDTTRITVENHALGGRSSRTYLTEGLWDRVLPALQKGDYLLIQFGHNDGGPMNTGRARASLKGTGEESETVIMERNGGPEEVFSFGHYLRLYIRQAKAVGAIPIVLSPTPGNRWTEGKVNRMTESYANWAKEVAEQEGVAFVDLNALSADKMDSMGETKGKELFKDSVHTTYEGAIMNGRSVIEGLQKLTGCSLKSYIRP